MDSFKSKTTIGTLFVILCVVLVLFTYLDQPTGPGEEVTGEATRILYITPKLEAPFTEFTVILSNGDIVTAEGPPNLPIKKNSKVVLLKRAKMISGGDSYAFEKYLKE